MSLAYERLAEILQQKEGIEPNVTLSLLSIVEAHDQLILFSAVSQNLSNILPLLLRIDSISWPQTQVDGWVQVCIAAYNHRRHISLAIPEYTELKKDKQSPIHGIIGSYPLYAALWCRPPSEVALNDAFFHLQAHLINSFHAFTGLVKKGKTYDSMSLCASRTVRKFATDGGLQSLLDRLPRRVQTEEQFLETARGFLAYESLTEDERDEIVVLERLLSFALGQRGGFTRGSHDDVSVAPISTIEVVDPDGEFAFKPQRFVHTSGLTVSEAQKARKAGCASSEQYHGPRFVRAGDETKLDRGGSLRQQAMKARNKNRYIATNNQLLPFRWERLNSYDVAQLLHFLGDALRVRPSRRADAKGGQEELVALLSTMLWTASPFERAMTARITASLKSLPKSISEGDVYYCIDDDVWVIGTPELEQRRKGKASWSNYLRPSQPKVFLPCHPLVAKMMRPWLRKQGSSIKRQSRPLFTASSDDLSESLKKCIATINKEHNTRLTLHRIATLLPQLISDYTTDFADASLITGRTPPSGQLNALYYYTPGVNTLARRYQDVCHGVVSAVFQALDKKEPPEKPQRMKLAYTYVGSEICLLEQTVHLLAKDLKAKVVYARKNRLSAHALVEFHNAFTTYCTMMLGFATGYRVVRDPFYSESDVDLETGFVVITDKDSDDYYNTRLTWLPDICLQQVQLYSRHRAALAERLTLLNMQTANLLKPAKTTAWSRRHFDSKNAAPFLFYLDESAVVRPVSETSLQASVEWSYEIALNANRHYLRTRLREEKVTGEVVNAFMGHWDRGQEPHGRYSSLSPMAFRAELEKPLTNLISRAGWALLNGYK